MDFEKFSLKKYRHFELYLHQEQFPYIGRSYAWSLRDDAKEIRDMKRGELIELHQEIFPEWENSVRKLFGSNWSNLAIFGNTSPHLHAHLIPRYESLVRFSGIEFVDKNPRGNYSPYQKMSLNEEVLFGIRDLMKCEIQNN